MLGSKWNLYNKTEHMTIHAIGPYETDLGIVNSFMDVKKSIASLVKSRIFSETLSFVLGCFALIMWTAKWHIRRSVNKGHMGMGGVWG